MTEQQKLMQKIRQSAFAAHECVLYLDNHPGCRKALERHAEAVRALEEYTKKYESSYGALTANSANKNNGWSWTKGPWPWQCTED